MDQALAILISVFGIFAIVVIVGRTYIGIKMDQFRNHARFCACGKTLKGCTNPLFSEV